MSLTISLTRLKVGIFSLDVFQADGVTPQSLSGATLYFHATIGGISIDKSSPSDGISITDAGGGSDCAQLMIDADDTADIPAGGPYSGDCELTMVVSDVPYELAKGTLYVAQNVGTP